MNEKSLSINKYKINIYLYIIKKTSSFFQRFFVKTIFYYLELVIYFGKAKIDN
jgi:hypothetical protein